MIDFVAIPTVIFELQSYKALRPKDREFLLHLYRMYSDCDSFTVDWKQAGLFNDETGNSVLNRIKRLIGVKLIVQIEKLPSMRHGPRTRVFGFTYPVTQVYDSLVAHRVVVRRSALGVA